MLKIRFEKSDGLAEVYPDGPSYTEVGEYQYVQFIYQAIYAGKYGEDGTEIAVYDSNGTWVYGEHRYSDVIIYES